MIRDPSDGTVKDSFAHLKKTFDMAARSFPEIMEPYQVMMVDAEGDFSSQTSIMREGLRTTFKRRYPSRFQSPESGRDSLLT